jgi:flagellar biosynthesis/type III secretory pathway chaperone
MTTMSVAPTNSDSAAMPVATVADAEQLAGHLDGVMDSLVSLVEEETELVRTGKLRDASRLETAKSDLARLYLMDTRRIQASQRYLATAAPELIRRLGQRHDTFRAVLQMNLTVLATVHGVAESIIRGLSSELMRKSAPQTYGASGRASVPARNTVQPLSLSRSL